MISFLLLLATIHAAPTLPETIAATCPTQWDVDLIHGKSGSIWFYSCEQTGVTITVPTNVKRAGLVGSTKGQPEKRWTR